MITSTSPQEDTLLLDSEVPNVLGPFGEADQHTYIAESFVHGFIDGES